MSQEDLRLRLVGRKNDVDEKPQGADWILFQAFEAWSVLIALEKSGSQVRGILGQALLQGNAHILVINLGKLIDKGKDQPHSLRKIWFDYRDKLNPSG